MFNRSQISSTELRQVGQLFDQIKADPYVVLTLMKYNSPEAVLLSSELWDLVEDALLGKARIFKVELAGFEDAEEGEEIPFKLVVARMQDRQEDQPRQWDVLVDWMAYTLVEHAPGTPASEVRPDGQQLVWRHHADVARRVLTEFTSAAE